jgi:hypothetical protein
MACLPSKVSPTGDHRYSFVVLRCGQANIIEHATRGITTLLTHAPLISLSPLPASTSLPIDEKENKVTSMRTGEWLFGSARKKPPHPDQVLASLWQHNHDDRASSDQHDIIVLVSVIGHNKWRGVARVITSITVAGDAANTNGQSSVKLEWLCYYPVGNGTSKDDLQPGLPFGSCTHLTYERPIHSGHSAGGGAGEGGGSRMNRAISALVNDAKDGDIIPYSCGIAIWTMMDNHITTILDVTESAANEARLPHSSIPSSSSSSSSSSPSGTSTPSKKKLSSVSAEEAKTLTFAPFFVRSEDTPPVTFIKELTDHLMSTLSGRVIMASLIGSRRYNLASEDTSSDNDYLVVYVGDTRDMFRVHPPPQSYTNPPGVVPDLVVLEVAAFAKLLVDGDPRVVECIYLHHNHLLTSSLEWQQLSSIISNGLVTRQVIDKYIRDAEGPQKLGALKREWTNTGIPCIPSTTTVSSKQKWKNKSIGTSTPTTTPTPPTTTSESSTPTSIPSTATMDSRARKLWYLVYRLVIMAEYALKHRRLQPWYVVLYYMGMVINPCLSLWMLYAWCSGLLLTHLNVK